MTTPTPEPTATLTPSTTYTPSPEPTATSTPTITPSPEPSLTPTDTLTPTITPTASATPVATAVFTNDQWTTVTVDPALTDGISSSWFAFINANERAATENLLTPIPSSETETIYLADPSTGDRVRIIDLPYSTGDRVYWSPDGMKMLYFMEPSIASNGMQVGGLYLLDLQVGISLRVLNIESLSPRGIPEHRPVWSPDSSRFAIALPTEYDVDIYVIAEDGSSFLNVTSNGSFDLWPAWSPDGRDLAFVSDRATCPSWIPGDDGSCATIDATAPMSGRLYTVDVETGDTRQVSEVVVDGPPTWITNSQVAFSTGVVDVFASESHIYLADVTSGTVRQISSDDQDINLAPAWASGGTEVLYYEASDPGQVVLRDRQGNRLASLDDYTFPRYGFAAAWSPDGRYVAIGGHNGQCPYGLIVAGEDNLQIVYGPAQTPRVCDPSYSPDGRWLAFAGITYVAGVDDGRLDVYIGQPNGYSAQNQTGSLRGEIRLLGWVGPQQ
ncbi:TolB family protein [Aggregatilinea lenta]|uniref:TolB family protein n=1 Tax=Aggregatilinea lenta TaxID=913108 RepID=UPI0013C36EEF|nr:PD40 domain-containing protein [Aggregatilinea lenta]